MTRRCEDCAQSQGQDCIFLRDAGPFDASIPQLGLHFFILASLRAFCLAIHDEVTCLTLTVGSNSKVDDILSCSCAAA
jgi:hypothetical protein